MSIKTKAALRTLAFLGASVASALFFIVVGYFFGEGTALITLAVILLSYLSWSVYSYNVTQLEIEEKYSKK